MSNHVERRVATMSSGGTFANTFTALCPFCNVECQTSVRTDGRGKFDSTSELHEGRCVHHVETDADQGEMVFVISSEIIKAESALDLGKAWMELCKMDGADADEVKRRIRRVKTFVLNVRQEIMSDNIEIHYVEGGEKHERTEATAERL